MTSEIRQVSVSRIGRQQNDAYVSALQNGSRVRRLCLCTVAYST